MKLAPEAAFARAVEVVKGAGFDIVAQRADKGVVQAAATTAWFRFVDDVAIRVTPVADGSRIDIRSKSRVGRSDLGANAARIRRLAEAFKAKDCCVDPGS